MSMDPSSQEGSSESCGGCLSTSSEDHLPLQDGPAQPPCSEQPIDDSGIFPSTSSKTQLEDSVESSAQHEDALESSEELKNKRKFDSHDGTSNNNVPKRSFRLPVKKITNQPNLQASVVNIPRKECSKGCSNDCMSNSMSLSPEDRLKLKEFNKETSNETKNNLLGYLWAQDLIVEDDKNGFVFNGFLYCLKSFASLTGVSIYLLQQVTDHFERGLKGPFVHQGKDSSKLHMKSVQFIAWFQV